MAILKHQSCDPSLVFVEHRAYHQTLLQSSFIVGFAAAMPITRALNTSLILQGRKYHAVQEVFRE